MKLAAIQDHAHHIMVKGSEYELGFFTVDGVRRIVLQLCLYVIVLLAGFYTHFLLLVKNTQKQGVPASGSPEWPPELYEDVQKLHVYSQK